MYKILIADDEEKIRCVIREYALAGGYEVYEAANGSEAIEKCRETNFDAIIMDIMMPLVDGISAAKEILSFCDVPILMLSARGEETDKLSGFDIGADDYVVKPFSPKEVMARLSVLIRRNCKQSTDEEESFAQFGGLKIDFDGRSIIVDGKKAEVTAKEYELFEFLVLNKNIALSRDRILTKVWGYDFGGDDRTLDTHIKMLRGKLGTYRDYIVTLRGYGYKFEVIQ